MKKILILIFASLVSIAQGQELNCQVSVQAPSIQGTADKEIFNTMQTAVREFMNNTKWGTDKFQNEERIECQITITVNEKISADEFKGKIEIKSSRPVFKSTYSSPMLSISDQYFQFKFNQFQTLEYIETNLNPNLIAVLAYYANIIIGFDYDSYSMLGGTAYFSKAHAIVNQMNSAREPGWRAFESDRDRYWLTENLLSPNYKPIRELEYNMHLKALDNMTKDKETSVRLIADGLEALKPVHNDKPNAYLLTVFFDAKSDELVNIFSGAPGDVKTKAKQTLDEINPANSNKYSKILEN
ncbi:MAG: DUF4835 family protein [Bacteroidia bacterium]